MNSIVSINTSRKAAIAEAFGKAAHSYDQHAQFQRDIGTELINSLPQDLSGMKVLDMGCGTGFFAEILTQRGAIVTAADLSLEMLEQAKCRCEDKVASYHQSDAEDLPFKAHQFDIVFSNLTLQWCENLANPLKELQRVTKKGGKIFFSTLLQDSLIELRQAWAEVDLHQHVNTFLSKKQINIALAQSGAVNHHLNLQTIRLWYPSAFSVMRSLKGIGATYVGERFLGLTKKSTLARVETEYQKFKNDKALLPVTYQVCLGTIIL